MKKILFVVVLLMVCTKMFADSAYIREVSSTTGLLREVTGQDSNGDPTYGDLNMTEYSTNLYYAVKEITVDVNTLIEYRVYHVVLGTTHDHAYSSNNTSNGNAWVYLPEGGTYTLVFRYKYNTLGNDELDVIQIACVTGGDPGQSAGDDNDFFGKAWNEGYTENCMDYNWEDNNFHFTKDIETTGSRTINYKVLARHRTFEPQGKGWHPDGTGNELQISIPSAGKYTVDISFNPITRDNATATVTRYEELDVTSVGFATFSCPFAAAVPNTLIARYVTSYSTAEVVTSKTKKVPKTERNSATDNPIAGTGVIVEGSEGTYRFYEISETVTLSGNKLSGTGSYSYEAANNTTYVFAEKDGVIGFYKGYGEGTADRTYAAKKAYLPLSNGSSREFYGLDFLNNSSGITAVKGLKENGRYYNLQGQPVAHPTKGLYILNGKKVMVR